MKKNKIHQHVIDKYLADQKNLVALEYGRIRSSTPRVNRAGGWSTLHIPEHPRVKILHSLDINPKTVDVCEEVIPPDVLERVNFAEKLSDLGLNPQGIDLLFLDADNDAKQAFDLYRQTLSYLKDGTVVLLDDVYSRPGVKGDVLVPYWESHDYTVIQLHPMAAIRYDGRDYEKT